MNEKRESQFNASEQAEIVEAIQRMPVLAQGDVASFKMLIRWIEVWYHFVDEIEEGYRMSIYDYHNDMDYRLNLTELMDLIPDPTAGKIQAMIDSADQKYFDVTIPLNKPQCSFFSWYSIEWSRKPKKLIVAGQNIVKGTNKATFITS